MKEVASIAYNTCALLSGGKLQPSAEVALVLAEPRYALTSDGALARERSCETVRFCMSPDGMRKLAKSLTTAASDMEEEIAAAMLPIQPAKKEDSK